MHRRPFGSIQHSRLDKGLINILSHFTAKRVDLSYQMTFAGPSDIRIAWHQRYTVYTYSKNNSFHAKTRRCQRSFTSRMPRAYHNNIISFFYKIIHTMINPPEISFLIHMGSLHASHSRKPACPSDTLTQSSF